MGFQLVLSLLLVSVLVSGKVTFKVETESNPEIFPNFRINIRNATMQLTTDVLRVLEGKIMYKFNFMRLLPNGRRTKLMDVPKMNYCYVRRNLDAAPLMNGFIEYLNPYGNWTAYCPWKPGLYGLWNVPMDDHFLPMKNMIPRGDYLMTNNITDENGSVQLLVNFKMLITVS